MICAIHQPNFFPWLGYFDKMSKADTFVFLDQVEYPKSSKTMSTWSNRVAILLGGEKHWINCPVIREEGIQRICDVNINNEYDWRRKIITSIELNYSKCLYYNEVADFIFTLLNIHTDKLADYNCYVITEIANKLGIMVKFIRQTEIHTEKASTNLLIEITKTVGCNAYLCGGGATGYQQDTLFFQQGIDLIYQNFIPSLYRQNKDGFEPGLSVMDALFNCGFDGVHALLNMGD